MADEWSPRQLLNALLHHKVASIHFVMQERSKPHSEVIRTAMPEDSPHLLDGRRPPTFPGRVVQPVGAVLVGDLRI